MGYMTSTPLQKDATITPFSSFLLFTASHYSNNSVKFLQLIFKATSLAQGHVKQDDIVYLLQNYQG